MVFLHLLLLNTDCSGEWAGLHGRELAVSGRSCLSSRVVGAVVYPQEICGNPTLGICDCDVTLFGKRVFVAVIKM